MRAIMLRTRKFVITLRAASDKPCNSIAALLGTTAPGSMRMESFLSASRSIGTGKQTLDSAAWLNTDPPAMLDGNNEMWCLSLTADEGPDAVTLLTKRVLLRFQSSNHHGIRLRQLHNKGYTGSVLRFFSHAESWSTRDPIVTAVCRDWSDFLRTESVTHATVTRTTLHKSLISKNFLGLSCIRIANHDWVCTMIEPVKFPVPTVCVLHHSQRRYGSWIRSLWNILWVATDIGIFYGEPRFNWILPQHLA